MVFIVKVSNLDQQCCDLMMLVAWFDSFKIVSRFRLLALVLCMEHKIIA